MSAVIVWKVFACFKGLVGVGFVCFFPLFP